MAHPVRPEQYIEINNFYTMTVYNKGAEVIRMLHTLLGAEGFRRGMDLYFERHDGQAVTVEDFVAALADANGRWYRQAGTPILSVGEHWDAERRRYSLVLEQRSPPTPGQPDKVPLRIPVAVGLLGADGTDLPLQLDGETAPHPGTTRVPGTVAAARILGPSAPRLSRAQRAPRAADGPRSGSLQPLGRGPAARRFAAARTRRGLACRAAARAA
jgi:aminopeptidase N